MKGSKMTTATKTAKPVITAPKITNAWLKVVSTSNAGEAKTVEAIENLSAVMVLESGLSVRDVKAVIKASGKSCGMVSVSHVEALPTWSKLRAKHEAFKALPLAKQLSTASASYTLLGAGNGEKYPTLDALQSEIKTVRKAKQSEQPKEPKSAKTKAPKDTLGEILAYFTALNTDALDDDQKDTLAEIQYVIEGKMASA